MISIAMMKHHEQKQLWEERVYFTFQHHPAKSGKKPIKKQRQELKAMEECCLLAYYSWLAQPAFFGSGQS